MNFGLYSLAGRRETLYSTRSALAPDLVDWLRAFMTAAQISLEEQLYMTISPDPLSTSNSPDQGADV